MILPIKLFYQLVPLGMFLIQTAQSRYDLFVLLLLLLLLLFFCIFTAGLFYVHFILVRINKWMDQTVQKYCRKVQSLGQGATRLQTDSKTDGQTTDRQTNLRRHKANVATLRSPNKSSGYVQYDDISNRALIVN